MKFKSLIIFYWLKFKFLSRIKTRAALNRYQHKRIHRFIQKTLVKAPFYIPYISGKTTLGDFPLVNKKIFMDHFDGMNTLDIKLEDAMRVALEAEKSRDFTATLQGVSVGLSTGTSGKRGIFLVSEKERAAWTAMVLHRVLKPKWFKKQKVAFFLRANNNLYTSVQSSLIEFEFFDIFKPIVDLAEKLEHFQPDCLAAQPSVLIELGRLKASKGYQFSPEKIISYAEVLDSDDKQQIEQFFNCPITEVYQCTEGFLGVSCEHGVMHLNEDIIHIEKDRIDAHRFYPILTDFSRSSQPVVRYRLDDILVEKSEKCACGSPLIAIDRIIGRADDTLIFNGQDGQISIFPDLICRRIALETNDFTRYQIRQTTLTTVEVYIEADQEKFEVCEKRFTEALTNLLAEFRVHTVSIQCIQGLDHPLGSKFRRVESKISKMEINLS